MNPKRSTSIYIIIFLILVGALGSTTSIQAQSNQVPLRQAIQPHGLVFGTAVQVPALQSDPLYAPTIVREFNMVTPENAQGMRKVYRGRNQFNFTEMDTFMNFADGNNLDVHGRVSIWYKAVPDWVQNGNFTRDQAIQILREYVLAVVGRYSGRMIQWDVVNEVFEEDGSFRQSYWYTKIGPEYIDMAFRWAHEADPNTILLYNDFNNEGMTAKSNAQYELVKGMVERGVPIHGVGLQMHLENISPPNLDAMKQNMARIGALGLEVQYTELEVQTYYGPGTAQEKREKQAVIYGDVVKLCLETANCTGITTWGFTDKYSWRAFDLPLPLDANFQPKPAYVRMSEIMVNTPPRSGTPTTPPPTPLPEPTTPTVVVDVQTISATQVNVAFKLYKIANLYGLETRCTVDPNVLGGTSRVDGDTFNGSNSLFIDQGFNANGNWVIAASRTQQHGAVSGNGTAFTLGYTVKTAGSSTVQCQVLAVDVNGRDVPLEVIGGTYIPAIIPTNPITVPEIPTVPVVTPLPAALSTVAGVTSYQNAPVNAGITVQLRDNAGTPLAQVVTTETGAYSFTDVPVGSYILYVSAPSHLSTLRSVNVTGDGSLIQLPDSLLLAGDTDNNGIIDLLDASFIGANFTMQSPPAPISVDLNQDTLINISDLVLVGANFGQATPTTPLP